MSEEITLGLWVALIAFIPLLTFPIILFLGQMYNGERWWKDALKEGGIISLFAMGIVFVLTMMVAYLYAGHLLKAGATDVWDWISFDVLRSDGLTTGYDLGFGIWIDHVSLMLLFVASFLCFLINWFSIGYMNTDSVNDGRNHRFYAEFLIFCAGMLGMVLADNFLWLFIFWEIMGLCSYLLIGFYFERPSAAAAAKKAFLTTRVGDVFLMVGLIMLWNLFDGHLDFAYVFDEANIAAVDAGSLQLALLMMFIGAVGKSAQFPLHVWLPDAMEGPTPVSALIHAATMVNAGLYLVARMFPIFSGVEAGEMSDLAMLIMFIGGFTAIMAAGIAMVQNDIKRVLAYSTMSQLAYIFTGLGAAMWFAGEGYDELAILAFGASLFHLFNHAMAKGMLFMASGSVIHEMHHAEHRLGGDEHLDAQDMTNMGGLASRMPVTAIAMAAGSMSIIGIPLIGGFWSKEGIIARSWDAAMHDGGAMMFIPAMFILLTAGMTGFYMSRMWFMTFAGPPKSRVASLVHEQTPWIKFPLVVLTFMTLGGILFAAMEFVHWVAADHAFGFDLLGEMKHAFLPAETSFLLLTWMTIALSTVIGPGIAMALYGGRLRDGQQAHPAIAWLMTISVWARGRFHFDNSILAQSGLAEALRRRLYIDDAYEWLCARLVIPFALGLAWFDERGVDGVIKGIEGGSQETSRWLRGFTTGSARDYIMMAALGTLVLVGLIWGVA